MASKNYINNKTLYTAMVEYRSKVNEAKRNNKPLPQIPRYIGEAILLIPTNLAKKPNFSGYSHKEDMINDAVIDCVAAVDKFDPDKTNNPFAYFTQISWNAFLRRIQKEKKQTYIKHKNYENSFLMDELFAGESNMQLGYNEYSAEVVGSFEKKMLTKTKKKGKVTGVEKFANTDIDDEKSDFEENDLEIE